jgi:uncharacterized membrane protein YfcA
VQAAGITLPILVASDIIALFTYRREFDKAVLKAMLPGAFFGLAIAWATAAYVTEHWIRLIVGVVSVLFAIDYWFRHKRAVRPSEPNLGKALFFGTITGFVSFVSHSGGPPYQMYAAPLRLSPRVFAGTSVIFFAIVNAVKLVPYFFLGQFDKENLLAALVISPVAILAVFLSVWLVKRIDPRAFYDVIYAMIFVVGLFLVWQGASALG